LTIHGLLHIAWGIKVAGPVWTYWAFAMERHCNTLLRSVKSRRHPYASIASFVTATAQLDQIRLFYDLHDELFLDPEKKGKQQACPQFVYVLLMIFTLAVHLSLEFK
jgi:hypothetical protein